MMKKDYTQATMWERTHSEYRSVDGRFTIRMQWDQSTDWHLVDKQTNEDFFAYSFMKCVEKAQKMADEHETI